jgi:hypothetical protein
MSLGVPFETGELKQRDGGPDNVTIPGAAVSQRTQYAPDNRKVPPEPRRAIDDVTGVAVPSASDLFADALGAVQNTVLSPDGSIMHGVLVSFTPSNWWGTASRFDVYAADESDFPADCFIRIGSIQTEPGKSFDQFVPAPQLIRGRTYTIAVVPVNADGAGIEAEAAPQVTGVSFGASGQVPPDVADFDTFVDCCDILFSWTPVTSVRNDVAYYEVRQGANFAGGVFIGRAWGWNQGALRVPIGQVPNALSAPDNEFHMKAFTQLGAESAAEDSDTLTTIQINNLQAYCCTKVREITPTPGLDTVAITNLAPTPAGLQPNVNIGAGAGNPGPNGVLRGAIVPTSFTPNGSRWDYSVVLSDIAISGDRIYVTEGVRLAV